MAWQCIPSLSVNQSMEPAVFSYCPRRRVFFLGIAGMQLNSRLSMRVVYLNTEWLFHEALLGLNFKTCCFAHWGGGHNAVGILLLCFSLLLSQFLPIFVSFVAISAVLCRCFKIMSLVGILPEEGLFHSLFTFAEKQSTCLSWRLYGS